MIMILMPDQQIYLPSHLCVYLPEMKTSGKESNVTPTHQGPVSSSTLNSKSDFKSYMKHKSKMQYIERALRKHG